MKTLKIVVLFLLAFDVFAQARSLDQTVRVLGVITRNGNMDQAITALQGLKTAYDSAPGGLTVALANSGIPEFAPNIAFRTDNSTITSTGYNFTVDVSDDFRVQELRDQHNADVVIIFTGGGLFLEGTCGLMGIPRSGHWIDTPVTDAKFVFNRFSSEGDRNAVLDLFGAEEHYFATVVQDEECNVLRQISATHEFGHVFGGGHHLEIPNPINGFSWLLQNSHASLAVFNFGAFNMPNSFVCSFSALGTPGLLGDDRACPPAIAPFGTRTIVRQNRYSDGSVDFNYANNAAAIGKTSLSVANYRSDIVISDDRLPDTLCSDGIDNDNDGLKDLEDGDCTSDSDNSESGSFGAPPVASENGCTLARPRFLNSTLQNGLACNPAPDTVYDVSWSPGNNCPVHYYEVFGSPAGTQYQRAGSTSVPFGTITVSGVFGLQSFARVRACTENNECTRLSGEAFTFTNQCSTP